MKSFLFSQIGYKNISLKQTRLKGFRDLEWGKGGLLILTSGLIGYRK